MKIRQLSTRRMQQRFTAVLGALIVLSLVAVPATADHSWGSYHWARTSNGTDGFPLPVGNNLTNPGEYGWDTYLDTAIIDWNGSKVIHLGEEQGRTTPKQCKPVAGTIQVCNDAYGKRGWLGLAQIWVSGGHITQGTSKLNDSYFNMTKYDTPAWRLMVMCQEIAHDFGLDHQDEAFDNPNLGSCMDYTSDPDGGPYGDSTTQTHPSNEHPDFLYKNHDFAQLDLIYGQHADSTNGAATSTNTTAADEAVSSNDPSDWGAVIERDGKGRPSHYEKDLGNGKKVFTFVIYADEKQTPAGDNGTGNDGTGDSGKRDGGKKADNKQDGGKKDGGKQRQGRHDKRNR